MEAQKKNTKQFMTEKGAKYLNVKKTAKSTSYREQLISTKKQETATTSISKLEQRN